MKVLFVGDDPQVAEMATLSVRLRWPDTQPMMVESVEEGLKVMEQLHPDIVLLHAACSDLSLPRAVRELRRISEVPVLILSSRDDEVKIVGALEQGADEYVRLPCDLTEMMIRIWALMRRVGVRPTWEKEEPLLSGQLFINPATYEVFLKGERIPLTSTEFRLLHLLIRNQNTVVSHKSLEAALWGGQVDSSGLAKKYVQRLRRKMRDNARQPHWIASVHGVGYRFVGPSPRIQEQAQPALVASG